MIFLIQVFIWTIVEIHIATMWDMCLIFAMKILFEHYCQFNRFLAAVIFVKIGFCLCMNLATLVLLFIIWNRYQNVRQSHKKYRFVANIFDYVTLSQFDISLSFICGREEKPELYLNSKGIRHWTVNKTCTQWFKTLSLICWLISFY